MEFPKFDPDFNSMQNPYARPTSDLNANLTGTNVRYNTQSFYATSGRIGRIRYIAYGILMGLIMIGIIFGVSLLLGIIAGIFGAGSGSETLYMIIGGLVYLILIVGQLYISIVPAIRRLNDLNLTGWLSLLLLVPLVNLIFWLYLLFAPGDKGVNKYGAPAEPPSTAITVLAVVMPIIGVIFIGILAAIAIPAYQSYIERANEFQMDMAQ